MSSFHVLEDYLTGSNCYLMEEKKKVLLIDPNDDKKILKLLKQNDWKLEYILLTHEHCDHMQGLNGIRQWFSVKTIATNICSKNLGNRTKNMSGMMELYLRFKYGGDRRYSYASIVCDPADITFSDSYIFCWLGHTVCMKAVPGHTEGSCCIRIDEKNLFTGDYLIEGEDDITRLPGGNEASYQMFGKPWLDRLEAGLHIYPGHGKDYFLQERR